MNSEENINPAESTIYAFGEFRLEAKNLLLLRNSEVVPLAPKACEVLLTLVSANGKMLTKQEILDKVWADTFVEEANLTHHISALRKALGEDKNGRKFIETISRRGYRFVAEVREVVGDQAEITVSERVTTRFVVEETEFIADENQIGWASNVESSPGIKNELVPADFVSHELLSAKILNDESNSVKYIDNVSDTALESGQRSDIKTPKQAIWTKKLRFAMVAAIIIGITAAGYAFYQFFIFRAPVVFRAGMTRRLTTTGRVATPKISPDGRNLLYIKRVGSERSLWIRQTATDSDIQITPATPIDDIYGGAAFTPDGNYVYFSLKRKGEPYSVLYRVPAFGGATPVKILENLIAAISFSPDGKQFTFLRSFSEQKEYALMIADADGANERRLIARARPTHFNGHPAWSPDGQTIVCPVVDIEGGFHYQLLAVNVADGATTQIHSQRWQNIDNAAWLPDSSSVLLVAQSESSPATQIWQISIPSGEARQITSDTNIYASVGLTADARFLVANKIEQESHLWSMSVDDQNNLRQLTQGEDNYDGLGGIAWMPNGEKIIYQSKANGRGAIWQTTPDGGNSRHLVDDLGAGFAVSPNGSLIVYQNQESDSQGLWRFDTKDGTRKRLTIGVDITPSFSPDGKSILFSRLGNATNLWRVSIDGGEPIQLTDEFRTTTSPTVSPDGKYVAFAYSRAEKTLDSPQSGLAILPLEGKQAIKTFAISFPFGSLYEQVTLQWTPDGTGINYIVLRDGVSNIWRQMAAGGDPVPITNFTEGRVFNFAFSPDHKQIALARGKVISDVVLIENQK